MDINGKDINTVKAKMEGVQAQLTRAQETIAERDGQLESIKSSTGDIEELRQKVETLQAENQKTVSQYDAQMKELRLNSAIKLMIAGKVHDEDLTASQFDKTRLILNEDGTVTGLQDQLQAIQESKRFLFKGPVQPEKTAGFKFGIEPAKDGGSGMDAALDAAFGLGED
ncbi:Phage minor structural protein GP20 [anaerobic digester metagenome]